MVPGKRERSKVPSRADMEIMFQGPQPWLNNVYSLGKPAVEKTPECAICMELCADDRFDLRCGHAFHLRCLRELEGATCPCCRAEITIDVLPEADKMRQRLKERMDAENDHAAREFVTSLGRKRIDVGSAAWMTIVRWVMGHIGRERLAAFDGMIPNNYREHPDGPTLHNVVHELIPAEYACCSVANVMEGCRLWASRVDDDDKDEYRQLVTEWYVRKLQRNQYHSRKVDSEARLSFPMASSEDHKRCKRVALQRLYDQYLPGA